MNLPIETGIRQYVYDQLIACGSMPGYQEIADHFELDRHQVSAVTKGIRIGKTLITHPDTGDIWMAGPFSAETTQYRVVGRHASWWANCAWDMFGVATLVAEKVTIETSCTDCGDPWTLIASPDEPPTDDGIVHFLLPAREWYQDIGFT